MMPTASPPSIGAHELTGKWIGIVVARAVRVSQSRTVPSWPAETSRPSSVPSALTGPVHALGTLDGRLVSAGNDGTVRLWDTRTARAATIPIHFPVRSCASVDGRLAIGVTAGLLVLEVG